MSVALTLPSPSPELRGPGLVLTAWSEGDLPAVLEIAADPATRRWSGSLSQVHTLDDARAWMADRVGPGRLDWAVRDAATAALVGRTGLRRFHETLAAAEIGYGVHPAHRRRGVATRAVGTVTSYAFDVLGLTRLELIHDVGNQASCRVAARAGYAHEGTERAALDYPDGRVGDQHRHARLATDPPGPVAPPLSRAIEPVEIAAGAWQLRPPSAGEAADALAMLTDPLTVRFNPAPSVVDLDSARAWCDRAADWSDGTHATFSVLEASTGRLAGNVSLWRIDLVRNRDASVGYRTAPWARGRGVATAAVGAVTRWAFGFLGLERIELPHAVDNEASCRVAQRCGFPVEGVLRGAYRAEDGSRHDEHLHARLASG